MTKSTLTLDPLEARLAPVVAIEYLFLTSYGNTVVVSGRPLVTAPPPPFAGLRVDIGPGQPVGALVGWPPIRVGGW